MIENAQVELSIYGTFNETIYNARMNGRGCEFNDAVLDIYYSDYLTNTEKEFLLRLYVFRLRNKNIKLREKLKSYGWHYHNIETVLELDSEYKNLFINNNSKEDLEILLNCVQGSKIYHVPIDKINIMLDNKYNYEQKNKLLEVCKHDSYAFYYVLNPSYSFDKIDEIIDFVDKTRQENCDEKYINEKLNLYLIEN